MNYNDAEYQQFIQELAQHLSSHLSLFLGPYEPDKSKALRKISNETGLEVTEQDFNQIVSKIEQETFENIDAIFSKHQGSDTILHFTNGDKLCGAYTGFTHSKVKYATPQERYFLRKAKGFSGIIIINITEFDSADKTIRRSADSIITFPLPKSPVKRFLWHLRNYSLHGYDIKTKRPEIYEETAENF